MARGTKKPARSTSKPVTPPEPEPGPIVPNAAVSAAKEALRVALGERAFSLLPAKVLGVDTATFAWHADMPTTQPELTVWALINALKGSTTKGQLAVNSTKTIRLLDVRTKKSSKKLTEKTYELNFNAGQNCDAMLRHLYGEERPDTDSCLKCTKGNGALKGCVVGTGAASCANCDWNRSGAACSFTVLGRKRKAPADNDSGSDGDDSDPFEALDRKTCLALAQIFTEATHRKKHMRTPSKRS